MLVGVYYDDDQSQAQSISLRMVRHARSDGQREFGPRG